MGNALKGQGFSVTEAANGQDGLDKASKASFSVIIADDMMPVMDGLTLVKNLRAAGVKLRAIAQRYGVTRDYVSKLCCGIIHGDQTSALRAELRPVKARAK